MNKKWIARVGSVVVAGLVGGFVLARPDSKVVGMEPHVVASATAEQLKAVADLNVYFGHMSVGGNMVSAMPDVFAQAGVTAPEIVESTEAVDAGPGFVHSHIGTNGDPLGKIAAFDKILRSGMGDAVDVAAFKLCYVDLHDGDDVDTIFDAYRDTMTALERDYPDVTFLYLTVPLTTEVDGPIERAKRRVKAVLGRDNPVAPEHNVAREQLNSRIRAEYADSGRLFDIAAIQSTSADGTRRVRSHNGAEYFAMENFLASDPGHLNPDGGAIVASAFLAAISDAAD
jgi:hypothetical protein